MIQMESTNMSIRLSLPATNRWVIDKSIAIISAKAICGSQPYKTIIVLYKIVDKIG